MSVQTELTKIKRKVVTVKEKTKASFDKLESDTRLVLEEAKAAIEVMSVNIEKEIEEVNEAIESYFRSDDFLKVNIEQAQFDAEVRAELKHYNQWTPNEGEYCVAVNRINWSSRKAAAALRQDPEKHLTITPVAKPNQRALQKVVLADVGGDAANLLTKLDALEDDLSRLSNEIRTFDERTEFYSIVLRGE